MRTIKFRGRHLCGQWYYGNIIIRETDSPVPETPNLYRCVLIGDIEDGSEEEVEEDTVGQFYKTTYCGNPTPVDLYEGDIVEGYQPYNEDNPHKGQIVWYNDDRFSLLTTDNYIEDLTVFTITKKLGNIHDNPELLK